MVCSGLKDQKYPNNLISQYATHFPPRCLFVTAFPYYREQGDPMRRLNLARHCHRRLE